MSYKLVLIATSNNILTPESSKLMYRIKREGLLCKIPWRSKERSCWTFRIPFLSIINTSSVHIIQNQDDILDYLKNLPPLKCDIDPNKKLFF